jgi:acylpyruvate hydrolase
MKIFCVGRNYADHAKELKNDLPTAPVIFMKPDTALLRENAAFYYPDFSKDIHHEVELVVKIDKEGKNIQEKFSSKYYNEIGVGIDFTARDLQNELKSKGLPWEISKAFNGSAAVSSFVNKSDLKELQNLKISLSINSEIKQSGNTKDMIFSIDTVIAYISQFFTLKKGDLIYTGTPAGVGSIKIGDKIKCFLEDNKMLDCEVK